jgi:hypothetical protein
MLTDVIVAGTAGQVRSRETKQGSVTFVTGLAKKA